MADLSLRQLCGEHGADDLVVLCANARLARRLRAVHGRAQAARGLMRWQALATATAAQWLGHVVGMAVLAGEVPPAAARHVGLNAAQERLLWERAIEDDAGGEALFDREGLAQLAAQANELAEAWRLQPDGEAHGEETAAFLRWRENFRALLDASGWLEPVRFAEWQIGCIARGAGRLPGRVVFAGFDACGPQEERLRRALAARGVAVLELALGGERPAAAAAVALPDAAAECRAAAAWAARLLDANPAARLAIVAPDVNALRHPLADALDAALHPGAFAPAEAGARRRYEFSSGAPLARVPLVATALSLLSLANEAQRIEQARLGELLRRPYWAAEEEADARDRLDAAMREFLAPEIALERALRLARRLEGKGVALPRTLAALETLQRDAAALRGRQLPSQWGTAFGSLIAAAGWPGERPLSDAERQAQAALVEALEGLGRFDAVLGRVAYGDALRQLQRICRERAFQAESADEPQLRVMGPLDVAAEPLDAIWIMGMTDQAWPPAARPNPLLPSALQRRAGTPGAGAEAQSQAARAIQRRWLHAAPAAVFSWAKTEAGRELRPSPLLAGMPAAPASDFPAPPDPIARLAGGAALFRIDDAQAPPLGGDEPVRGGTGLLKAQAICPAWAFHQYRLGARALAVPVAGLDPATRGTLLHAVLEAFWRDVATSAALAALDDAALEAVVARAAAAALASFDRGRDEPLSPRFAALERERLTRLAVAWLGFERGRPAPFRVVACEREVNVGIEGLPVRLVVDRIDELDDGRQLVIDYKTAASVSAKSWNDERIAEPQLPVYAAFAADGVAGAAFAQVRMGECGFVGVTANGGVLTKVAGMDEAAAAKLFPAAADWNGLLAHWRASIGAIAREVRAGVAAVRIGDENELAYCEVRPLLRLAEAAMQATERRQ